MCERERERERSSEKKLFINSECEDEECAVAGAEPGATEMWQGVFVFEKVPKKILFTINGRLCFNTLFIRNFNGKREWGMGEGE